MTDMDETVPVSSLSRYADDTTQYAADNSPIVLQYTLNKDMESIIILAWPQLSSCQWGLDTRDDRLWKLILHL